MQPETREQYVAHIRHVLEIEGQKWALSSLDALVVEVERLTAHVTQLIEEKGEAECLLGEHGAGGTPAGLVGGIHNLQSMREKAEAEVERLTEHVSNLALESKAYEEMTESLLAEVERLTARNEKLEQFAEFIVGEAKAHPGIGWLGTEAKAALGVEGNKVASESSEDARSPALEEQLPPDQAPTAEQRLAFAQGHLERMGRLRGREGNHPAQQEVYEMAYQDALVVVERLSVSANQSRSETAPNAT